MDKTLSRECFAVVPPLWVCSGYSTSPYVDTEEVPLVIFPTLLV